MRVIHKFKLEIRGHQYIMLPLGYEVIHIGYQLKVLYMWVLLDLNKPTKQVTVFIIGRNNEIKNETINKSSIHSTEKVVA